MCSSVSSGFSTMLALKTPSARVTESVAVSLIRRVSDLISPSRWVSWITSPGRIMSRLLRTSGRLRSSARSESFSSMPRNFWSSVSFRPIVIATNSKGAEGTLRCGSFIHRGRQEIIDRRIEQRVFDLGANRGKDGAGDHAGCDDAEAPRFCGGNGMGSLRKEGSGQRRVSGWRRSGTVNQWRNQGQPIDWVAFVLRHRYRPPGRRPRLPRPLPPHMIAACRRGLPARGIDAAGR